ncbi:MAG: efflux RND transporter permease subunit [Ignavibacteria bacterium]|nr:efflux RND transporter permease subunit [Ignavibacteria bacterium]
MSQHKSFPITAWAVENRTTIYVLTAIIFIIGYASYVRLPKEQFPDVVVPTILVTTINAGTSPIDVENLITRQIEKQIKSVADVKKVTSQSIQDASVITVEFTTDITPTLAKQRVSDAVDRAKADLPNDLTKGPDVAEIDFSEFPIMFVNIAGNVGLDNLKKYADELQDKIESLREIRRVDVIGALDKEVRVDVDPFLMQALGVSFDDLTRAISGENVNISGGDFVVGGVRRNVQVTSEFRSADEVKSVIVKGARGNTVYVRDIATVKETNMEQQSFARLDGETVVSLSVLKKAGENLIDASDQIQKIVEEYSKSKLPPNVTAVVTNDMSIATRTSISDLVNSIIIGFILVTLLLMFFMGVQNALFVGMATPLSSFLAFMVLPGLDFTFNIVVTFSFLLALGIVVDDAIVVIENTHRLHTKEGYPVEKAARYAAAEVFGPVVAGTLTTLAPFFPLLFWPGLIGKFMVYLPAVLIITLTASLVVAYIINPVFAVDFMSSKSKPLTKRRLTIAGVLIGLLVGIGLLSNAVWFLVLIGLNLAFFFVNRVFITPKLINPFQTHFLPWLMQLYRKTLGFILQGWRPFALTLGMVALLIVTFILTSMFGKSPVFFPSGEPNYSYVYIKMPIGTDAMVTDSIARVVEQRVLKILGKDNKLVKNVVTNVGIGAGDPRNPDRTVTPNKAKISVGFVEFQKRDGELTSQYLTKFRDALKDIAGAEISVEKEANGPPTGKDVNIEIAGDDFDVLEILAAKVKHLVVDSLQIQGIERLKSNLERNKPEVSIVVDREKANFEGISSAQIGMALRNALYGAEATKIRVGEEEYPVQVRIKESARQNMNALVNLPITFREMSSGNFRQVPIASVAKVEYASTFSGVNRKNQRRVVTLSSNVLIEEGFNATDVNKQIKQAIAGLNVPSGYDIRLTGAQEEQKETQDFLSFAFGIAAGLILMIMVTQFNSIGKPLMIMSTVLFSVIGVLLGFVIFQLQFSIVITGVGIIALGGIVVRNGIVLVDFTDVLRRDGYELREAIIEGGAIRFNPVILTAASTVLGLVPLAIGLNIDFWSLINLQDPHIHIGSDSVAFWGPLAWAIIFGLTFSTFLTLVLVPCFYYLQDISGKWLKKIILGPESDTANQV